MSQITETSKNPPAPLMRSGTVARLAGLPVTTLRVWERRYAVVAPPKTGTGQRLYTTEDVQRLKLLRQLTQRGYGIGTITNQSLERLRTLAAEAAAGVFEPVPQRLHVVAIGASAEQRLKGLAGCTIRGDFADLAAAEQAAAPLGSIDLLFVRLASLRAESAPRILALRDRLGVRAVSVLYAFGTEASAEALRAAGANVRREPIASRELARMIALQRTQSSLDEKRADYAERRFDDAQLVELTELPSAIACECRRHVAEIVMQLAGFERYSGECLVGSPADAALHQRLSALAEHARGMFEQALQNILAEEALAVPALARYLS